MSDEVRATVCELLATYGRPLLDDPRRLEALLKDFCGKYRREIFVLVCALRQRVAHDLLSASPHTPPELVTARLAQRLNDDLGLAPDVARWAVESWRQGLASLPSGQPAASEAAVDTNAAWADGAWLAAADDEAAAGRSVARPGSAPASGWTNGDVLVVSQWGGGDCTTIGEAIQRAKPGTRILVRYGVYNETLVLDRPVEIAGNNAVVEATEASCLRMQTDLAVVRGLHLRGWTGQANVDHVTVDIPQGTLVLEDCQITSGLLACVAIHGDASTPILRRCRITNGKQAGVYVYDGGGGVLEECEIAGHGHAGVWIRTDAHPTLRRCRITGGKRDGVAIGEDGSGQFHDCRIDANAMMGVRVAGGGNPILSGCAIIGNGRHGVWAYGGGALTVASCQLEPNGQSPLLVEDGCTLHHLAAVA